MHWLRNVCEDPCQLGELFTGEVSRFCLARLPVDPRLHGIRVPPLRQLSCVPRASSIVLCSVDIALGVCRPLPARIRRETPGRDGQHTTTPDSTAAPGHSEAQYHLVVRGSRSSSGSLGEQDDHDSSFGAVPHLVYESLVELGRSLPAFLGALIPRPQRYDATLSKGLPAPKEIAHLLAASEVSQKPRRASSVQKSRLPRENAQSDAQWADAVLPFQHEMFLKEGKEHRRHVRREVRKTAAGHLNRHGTPH